MLGHMGMIAEVQVNDSDRARYGNDLYGAFGRDFATKDDRRAMVVGLTDLQWSTLVKATGIGDATTALAQRLGLDLADEGHRFRARDEIAALLTPWFAARTLDEVRAALDAQRVTWGAYRTVRQALAEDADCSDANPMFGWIDAPGLGRHLAPGSPLHFSKIDRQPPVRAPRLGEHTDAILEGLLGLLAHDIRALHEAGTIQ
jgi:2-methylfumaryl-CoA isomerase